MKNFKGLNNQQFAMLIFESVMALLYPVFGVLLIIMDFPINYGFKIALGIVLILYGVFRIYRTFKKITAP